MENDLAKQGLFLDLRVSSWRTGALAIIVITMDGRLHCFRCLPRAPWHEVFPWHPRRSAHQIREKAWEEVTDERQSPTHHPGFSNTSSLASSSCFPSFTATVMDFLSFTRCDCGFLSSLGPRWRLSPQLSLTLNSEGGGYGNECFVL